MAVLDIYMRFRTAILWNCISQFGQSGIVFLSTVVLARMLTPDDFGLFGIVTIFIAFSQVMVDTEMGGALLRKKEVDTADYSTLFYYNLAMSIVIYAILWFAAPLIEDIYSRPRLVEVIRMSAVTIVIHAFRVVQRIMIFRELKFRTYAVINVAGGLISLIVAVALAKRGFGVMALAWQQIVLAGCNVIFLGCYNRFIPLLTFSRKSFRYQFSFGIHLFGSDAIRTIANNISTNIIAGISSLGFTGFYTQSSRITNFCQSTLGALMDQSIFPIMAKYDSMEKIRATYRRFLALVTLLTVCITILFTIFAHPLIAILLGKEWTGAVWIFRILALAICPTTIQTLCRNVIKATGKTRSIFWLETLKSALIISLLLIAAFLGTVWVIWSVVAAQTACCIIWMIATAKCVRNNSIVK